MVDDKTSSKAKSKKDEPAPTHWEFTGHYAAAYLPPDRVSRLVEPGEVVEWGQDGPPDANWVEAEAPKVEPKDSQGAASKSEGKE